MRIKKRAAASLEPVVAWPSGGSFAPEPSLRTRAAKAAMIHEKAGKPPTGKQLRHISRRTSTWRKVPIFTMPYTGAEKHAPVDSLSVL